MTGVFFYFPAEAHTGWASIPARRPHCLPPYMLDNTVSSVLAASSAPRGGDVASVTLTDSCSINPLISSRGARFDTLRLLGPNYRRRIQTQMCREMRSAHVISAGTSPLLPSGREPPLYRYRGDKRRRSGEMQRACAVRPPRRDDFILFFWYSVRMTVRRAGE